MESLHVCVHSDAEKEQRSRNNANGKRDPEPSASDPIFAAINKFNVQTPGMQENIKNENYILPRSCCQARIFMPMRVSLYTYIPPTTAHMCASHLHKYNYGAEYLKLHAVGKKCMRKLKLLCWRPLKCANKVSQDDANWTEATNWSPEIEGSNYIKG